MSIHLLILECSKVVWHCGTGQSPNLGAWYAEPTCEACLHVLGDLLMRLSQFWEALAV